MKSIAILLESPAYGNHTAQSGLNAALAAFAMIENLSVFFVGDGVLQLKKQQDTSTLQCKNQLPVYQLLALYDIESVYIDSTAMQKRGLNTNDLHYPYSQMNTHEIYQRIRSHCHLLSF